MVSIAGVVRGVGEVFAWKQFFEKVNAKFHIEY